jgi:hypothetical protein
MNFGTKKDTYFLNKKQKKETGKGVVIRRNYLKERRKR